MIEDVFKKFNGRFKEKLTINENTLMPIISIEDVSDGDKFQIQIESYVADIELVLENILNEKIINKRNSKIETIINGTIKKNRTC
jgi:hypothetical protein